MSMIRRLQRWLLRPFFRNVVDMPGLSFSGARPQLTAKQLEMRQRLKQHVYELALQIGERHIGLPRRLMQAAFYLEKELTALGYTVRRHAFSVSGVEMLNLDAQLPGASDEIVLVGAHYDTVFGSPGADDNATGVAATLEIARHFASSAKRRTLRFVFFANEECPANEEWQSMGSFAYARDCRARQENITAVLALEMLGYYSDKDGSQSYPWPFSVFYPSVGNFIAFVGNLASRDLVRKCIGSFRANAKIPSEGAAAPSWASDANRSDHWSFWQFGYPGLMVTDTSNFRYRLLHTAADTPDQIDFDRFTLVVEGLIAVVGELSQSG